MLKFNVITLFPQLIKPHLQELPFKRALEKNLINVSLINLRDFAVDKRGTVDDKPYGGGVGMILMIEPIYKALESLGLQNQEKQSAPSKHIVLLSPKGKTFNQKMAREFADADEITFICGRYEGVDARVEELATDIISVGNYVLSGGELAALTIMESATRLIPGVLEKEDATSIESFASTKETSETLEYPQYTRPKRFKNLSVPKVLLSGNHKEIEDWRQKNSIKLSDCDNINM